MEHYKMLNDILVNLFNEILGIEEKALTSSEFRDISVNDMHILEAVGTEEPRSMSSVDVYKRQGGTHRCGKNYFDESAFAILRCPGRFHSD